MSSQEKTTEELRRMKDEDIDFSEISELGEDFFQQARLVLPVEDQEVLFWFKKQYGKAYRARISAILRDHMDSDAV